MTKNNTALSEQVYTQYKLRIYGYMHQKGVPSADTDDLFSEIILKVTTLEDSFDPDKSSLSTWVYMLTRSVVVNHIKKKKPECELPESFVSEVDDYKAIELEEDLEKLAECLARLPERERQIIIYRYYRCMDYREIANAMKLTEVNARVICSRAVKKLASWMK